MDDISEDQNPVSRQIPHTRAAKGGFTNGRRLQHIRGETQRSVNRYPEREPKALDVVDNEINAAIREGRPIALELAFPSTAKHPRDTRRGHKPFGIKPASADLDTILENANIPTERSTNVQRRGSEYLTEYRIAILHRLLLRGLRLDQIGFMLGVSTRRVQSLRLDLMKRLKEEARHDDIYFIVGEALAFYKAVRNDCMEIASQDIGDLNRLVALQLALEAEADKHRFLQTCGFYEVVDFFPYAKNGEV
ncbi:hypothetical protein SAMN05444000_12840 [Shimia gijangensis]|uniref:Sigma-70, region 4 n=1 Tax=Shimia gijangensis TaxID=1470563 RepID=A0A1M6SAZ0_9RHOB|nr:hypothetical protein [Shimia gijangensis]SHK41866.1 hypothetical protein SAMN05444000_12840 [Shimia gijangensis]